MGKVYGFLFSERNMAVIIIKKLHQDNGVGSKHVLRKLVPSLFLLAPCPPMVDQSIQKRMGFLYILVDQNNQMLY